MVSPDGSHIQGIVSERDIVKRLSVLHTELLDEPVSSIMSTEVRVCSPGDDVESIMNLMTEHRSVTSPWSTPVGWSASSASATSSRAASRSSRRTATS